MTDIRNSTSSINSTSSLLLEDDLENGDMLLRRSPTQSSSGRQRSSMDMDEGFVEEDEEWCSPITKILKLPSDHESWEHAHELLEPPTPQARKVGDEARSIAARHIIDRLQEEDLLSKIHKVAPRLRSAVELLSKPDGDYVYPKFKFVVNELRRKYPEVYTSVIKNVKMHIPTEMKPATILVSLAKSTVENTAGQLQMNWGKFVSLLGLAGALAVDSVKVGYPDGVAEVVEAFGVIVEQVLGEWILSDGGGWEGFIELNVYSAKLPPVPRTIIIVLLASLVACLVIKVVWETVSLVAFGLGFWTTVEGSDLERMLVMYCGGKVHLGEGIINGVCYPPKNLLQYLCIRMLPEL